MRSGWAPNHLALALVGSLTLAFGGCAKPPLSEAQLTALNAQAQALADEFAASTVEATTGIVVRLAFGAEADLDLYVTDPLFDTVYFARHESSTGGVIDKDVRCDTPGPRIEEVRFTNPWPGRYRVGVDHPRRCDNQRSPAPAAYAVTVSANGATYSANGIVDLEFFKVVVLEFDIEDGGS